MAKSKKGNKKTKKVKANDLIALSVIAAIDTVLRLPYLFENGRALIGICTMVLAMVLVYMTLNEKSTSKNDGIVGIIVGILMLLSGSIVGNIIGILLIIDSIRACRSKKQP